MLICLSSLMVFSKWSLWKPQSHREEDRKISFGICHRSFMIRIEHRGVSLAGEAASEPA